MNTTNLIEKRAICEHRNTVKEVICGQKTGDKICQDCDECILPREKIIPVQFRSNYIITTRELMIVLKLNTGAYVRYDYSPSKYRELYPAVLLSKEDALILPIMRKVAQEAVDAGYVTLKS